MSESTDYSAVVFSPKVEAKIQKLVKNTGLTRNEVVQGLVMAFFDKIDQPSENVPALVLLVKTALRELGSGGYTALLSLPPLSLGRFMHRLPKHPVDGQ